MINEHDCVVLTCDIPDEALQAGDVGTVVHVYREGKAFEVEFVSLDGETVAVVTLERPQIRPVERREITHARRVAQRRAAHRSCRSVKRLLDACAWGGARQVLPTVHCGGIGSGVD